MTVSLFPPLTHPRIYAYSDQSFPGCLKVGYTAKAVARERVAEQYPTLRPEQTYTIELDEPAIREDGSLFKDHEVHKVLERHGIKRLSDSHDRITEWFECRLQDVQAALVEVRTGRHNEEKRTLSFGMRPEQQAAVNKTRAYFDQFHRDPANKGITPHFLWNAKMRFGKTFAAYQLALEMGWRKVLILTFKPAVQNAWQEDLQNHADFQGWQFLGSGGLSYEEADKTRPIVCFGSFQDFLGKNKAGGIKAKNEWVHTINWDCVIFDEYHYGAWRENAKDLFEGEDKSEQAFAEGGGMDYFNEDYLPITANHYLYLSGTPFRAIASGEFIEEQIFNWTYSDEQKAKAEWLPENGSNPYAALPRMVMMTYQLPDSIRDVAQRGEFNEFDLNEFFSAQGEGGDARFKYEEQVQKWLDLIRNALPEAAADTLKMGKGKPPMPFSDTRLLGSLLHTFWFLPSVAACHAMNTLLLQRQNRFYHDYHIIVAAGKEAGIGVNALPPVKEAMAVPLESKTITLSCGKLTTGVSVPPWTGILMLRNASSPETYFQAAFRVQTPWVLHGHDASDPNNELIVKNECYVFDFAPDRALRQISDYSCRLNTEDVSPEAKVGEFIRFLPVLAYDGSSMKQIDAAGILDMAMSGTTATLLARRWESALLVNVDNITLQKLMANEEAMAALQRIEGFRSLNEDIETIINKSEAVKKVKAEASERELSKEEKYQLTQDEKEYRNKRKEIQEKLIKFATRIPVFMYLTDFREHTLKDVITQLEPGLFQKVTGLTQKDFELLVSLNVFNSALMNDAVYKFKRYEDSSLEYTGLDKKKGLIGLYDTVLHRKNDLGI
ncbi:restriction endonuclease [Eikenella sp. NML96-A-049]|uniref:GIY-YIG nuclease family protein n=1 Tax=unclassified Eikenella TaxID=2639367 RepID=UPI0007E25B03|nr:MULTISPECIES: GIY-YIG nuclease family protein [unclassified Eikenella]OAM34140.1 restriction endonuclease [Eikenella sp. NML070372]OAM38886.1 restriction endonuclease [Eikenella sp. NML96-A-049]